MTVGIRTVGVIGAGTMGQGIAQTCATSGYQVLLFDQKQQLAEQAIRKIESSVKHLADKGKLEQQAALESLERLRSVQTINDVSADLIIEAVVEDLPIKQSVFSALENVNAPNTILATNTSSLTVTRIASGLNRPERFAGLHFFNPAPVMKLVEVVQTPATSSDTLAALRDFCITIGKQPVMVHDSPGFIVNRVARHFYLEALKIVEEGTADVETVDELLRASGFRMGPFELMDLIGIDVNLAVSKSIHSAFGEESRFQPRRLQQQKVDAGELGRKTGKGFYRYEGRSTKYEG